VSSKSIWPEYYQRLTGRQPRPLLGRALTMFEKDSTPNSGLQAIDLGCGDGIETLALIEQGWNVLSIDSEPEAMRLVESRVPAEKGGQLQTQNASFEAAQFVPANLIYAGLSLPFCAPQNFDTVWRNLVRSIKPGGRFAGHFFGNRDTWAANPDMTCLTRHHVESLFSEFEIEYFDESENDHPTALGDPKHWHSFEVIARKQT
jgi:tellurite methyltransferase